MSGNKLIDDYLSDLMDDGNGPEPAAAPPAAGDADAGAATPAPDQPPAEDTAPDDAASPDTAADEPAASAAAATATPPPAGAAAYASPNAPAPSPDLPTEPAGDPLAAFRSGGRNISDDEFEAMLDVLQGKAEPPPVLEQSAEAAPPAAAAPTTAAPGDDPLAVFRTGGRDISDDEFEAMLDVLQGNPAPPALAAAPAPSPPSRPAVAAADVPPDAPPPVASPPAPAPARPSRPLAAPTYLDTLPARQAEQLLPTGATRSPLMSPEPKPERHRRAEERISSWLRFTLGRQSFAVEVLKVQEVLRLSTILPVRGTDSAMLGVMNLRGQIVPVLDLALKLGFPSLPPTEASRIIVLEENGETLGLQVASVADVTNVSDARIERIGGTPSLVAAEVVRGVARRDGNIIIMLDASRLLA